MGVFTKVDKYGDRRLTAAGPFMGVAAAGAVIAGLNSVYFLAPNEMAIETRLRAFNGVETDQGMHLKLPFIEGKKVYDLGVKIDEFSGTYKTDQEVRFEADTRYQWRINADNETALKNLHYDLRNSKTTLDDIVENAVSIASDEVFGATKKINIAGDLDLRNEVRTRAQQILNGDLDGDGSTDAGATAWPVLLQSVNYKNINFLNAEEFLAELARSEQGVTKAEIDARKAQAQAAVSEAEAAKARAFVDEMVKSGVDPDVALCLFYAEQAGNSNEPGSPGCIPGTGANALTTGPN